MSADEIAGKAACQPRLVREWRDGQAASGLIGYDLATDCYELSPEAAMALADDSSPAWGDHHRCLFSGTEWFFRTGYRAELPGWIAALDGVADKLAAGGTVADVGCGHGASAVVLAQEFPAARITGLDFHAPSIETARQRAEEAGVSERTSFEVADAKSYTGSYDVIAFFGCLHDMGDPVGIARYAREHLAPGARRHCAARRAFRVRPAIGQYRRESDGGVALHRLVGDLHAQLLVAGGRSRAGGAGR